MQTIETAKRALLEASPKIRNLLPKGYPPERFLQVAYNCVAENPKLLECTPPSFLKCVLDAAELRLEPSGIQGHAWIIPFRDNKKGITAARLMIGYKGFVARMQRAGAARVAATCIWKGDDWQYEEGSSPRIKHIPAPPTGPHKREDLVAVYTSITYPAAGALVTEHHWMWASEVEETRKASKNPDSDPWRLWYAEMVKKTALRRHAKTLPLEDPLWIRALEVDSQDFDLEKPKPRERELSNGGTIRGIQETLDALAPTVQEPQEGPQEPPEPPEPPEAPEVPPPQPPPAAPPPRPAGRPSGGRFQQAEILPPAPPPVDQTAAERKALLERFRAANEFCRGTGEGWDVTDEELLGMPILDLREHTKEIESVAKAIQTRK